MQKKLVFFTATFPFGKGETFIETEILYLSKKFSEITIVPKNYYGDKFQRPVPKNVIVEKPLLYSNTFIRIIKGIFNLSPIMYFIREFFSSKVFLHPVKLFWWMMHSADTRALLANKRLSLILDEYPDAVWYFYWGRGTCYTIPFLKHFKNKKVVRFHRTDLNEKESKLSFRKQLFSNIDNAITISNYGKTYIETNYPQLKNKVILSRLGTKDNGISSASDDNTFRIVTCSSLIPLKRIHLLAKTLLSISEKKIEWTHIGDGGEKNKILEICKQFPSNIEYKFLGLLKNKDVISFYQTHKIDLFMNLSSIEGIPVSIMEAISFGIPVVATDAGSNNEIVDNTIGVLLRTHPEIEEIKQAILTISSQRNELLRQNARKKWESEYNADKNYEEFSEFLINR